MVVVVVVVVMVLFKLNTGSFTQFWIHFIGFSLFL